MLLIIGEAQKKLDELEDQKNRFHSEVVEIKEKCAAKQRDIDELDQKLKQQDRLEKVHMIILFIIIVNIVFSDSVFLYLSTFCFII